MVGVDVRVNGCLYAKIMQDMCEEQNIPSGYGYESASCSHSREQTFKKMKNPIECFGWRVLWKKSVDMEVLLGGIARCVQEEQRPMFRFASVWVHAHLWIRSGTARWSQESRGCQRGLGRREDSWCVKSDVRWKVASENLCEELECGKGESAMVHEGTPISHANVVTLRCHR